MALTGHLSDLSLSELIEFFCNQRKTGRLKVLYPQGEGYFYLQTGSVMDARIGVLRGIDAVYYALTLPNAKFEFSGAAEVPERTINQPWTQVVLEGLRRLDEGITPAEAFPPDYSAEPAGEDAKDTESIIETDIHDSLTPGFLSLMGNESGSKRKPWFVGAATLVVLGSVAVIGVPAGWYHRSKAPVVASPVTESVATTPQPVPASPQESPKPESPEAVTQQEDAAALARRQRERERAKAREERPAGNQVSNPSPSMGTTAVDANKGGAKKVSVTVTYDESGRVTQASGGDATALRIARQKRFPPGKAGSATITIPIN